MKKHIVDPFEIWEPWFAWYPIMVGSTWIWWERIERRLKMYGYDCVWEYRE